MIKLAELSGTADEIALATDIRNHLIDWLQTTSLKDAGPIKDNEIFAIHVEWLANEVLQYASDSSWWISCSGPRAWGWQNCCRPCATPWEPIP